MAKEILMPKLGMTMEKGTIIQWLKAEGDYVEAGEPILEVMTDKINIEVESYETGMILKLLYGENDVVPVNSVIGYIGEEGEQISVNTTRVRATPAARKLAREHQIQLQEIQGSGPQGRIQRADVSQYLQQDELSRETKSTPLARKVAQEHDIGLHTVSGSGSKGKIMKEDVLAHLEAEGAVQTDMAEKVNHHPHSIIKVEGIRRIIGERMAQSAYTAPHVTLTTEVDMSEAMRLREQLLPAIEKETGYRLSYTEILFKAVAHSLKQHPMVNASLQGEYILLNQVIHIGMAVAIPQGLLVPVVRDVDQKGLTSLTRECKELATRARENMLKPEDLQGGTFTISNLGMYAINWFTPIINQPESAILGVGRILEKPIGVAGKVELRPLLSLSLSFDHRVIDGAPAAAFLTGLKEALEQPYLLLL